jgi:RNA polymerase sigma-70 factor (sigma-E family)
MQRPDRTDNLLSPVRVLLGEMAMSSRDGSESWGAAFVSARDRELSALFDAHFSELRGLAFVILGDSHLAEEAVMDAFANVFSSWTRVRRLDWPYGYLRRAVVNSCRGRMRRRALEARIRTSSRKRSEIDESGWDADRSDARLDLRALVGRLPARQRLCVVLRYLEDMSEAEIAETLECSIGTVKSQTARARRSLQKWLAQDLEEEDEQRL